MRLIKDFLTKLSKDYDKEVLEIIESYLEKWGLYEE